MHNNSRHYDIQSRPFNPFKGSGGPTEPNRGMSTNRAVMSGPAMRMQKDQVNQHAGSGSVSKNLSVLKRYTMIARFVTEAKVREPSIDPVKLTREASEAASKQAQLLAEEIGGADLPWVISTLTATIATEMHQALSSMSPQNVLEFEWAKTLSPTCEIEAPLAYEPHHSNSNSRITLAIALQRAVLGLQRAYSHNNLFHSQWDPVGRWAAKQISGAVASVLEEPEMQVMLQGADNHTLVGQSLVRQAGQLLVDAWKVCGSNALKNLTTADGKSRTEIVRAGYPLDLVSNEFNELWSGVAEQLCGQYQSAGTLAAKLQTSPQID